MGILREGKSERRISLGQRCVVGRSAAAHLRLEGATVSGEHASIYFGGGDWKLRDLASLNGTRRNGKKVKEGRALTLNEGDLLQFGDHEDESWILECARPPGPSALGARHRVYSEDNTLWLPNEEEPEACIALRGGTWSLEHKDQIRQATNGETLLLSDDEFRLELPPMHEAALPATAAASEANDTEPLKLLFTLSADEEHIDLRALYLGREVALGARAHNEALLTLARRAKEELASGIEKAEAGWMYIDDFWKLLGHDREKLNLQLWRARQHFTRNKLPADGLIERRPDSRQIRIALPASIQKVSP